MIIHFLYKSAKIFFINNLLMKSKYDSERTLLSIIQLVKNEKMKINLSKFQFLKN